MHQPPYRRSIVIPMFNEAARIGTTLELLARSPLRSSDTELVLVDDGSSDDSAARATACAREAGLADIVVLRLPVNQGKGAAVRTGMLHASGASRVFVDADLSVSIDDIERCFTALESDDADVVFASRSHPASSLGHNQPVGRVLAGRAFNASLRALGLTLERDTQCGLKGFTDAAAKELFVDLATPGFAFDVEVLVRAQRAGLRLLSMPVEWDHVANSRVQTVRHGAEMLRSAVQIRRRLGPGPRATSVPRAMAPEAMTAMHEHEHDHWWFVAKRRLLLAELDHRQIRHGVVVDVGCGTGGVLAALHTHGHRPVGVDPDPLALELARASVVHAVLVRADGARLPLRDGIADAVTAFDVLEHLGDDLAGMRELARVVRPGGLIVVGVPAYQWAWSDHDVRLGHHRRYTRPMLEAVAHDAGLELLRSSYLHSWLVPPAYLLRRTPLKRLVGDDQEAASYGNRWVNGALGAVTRVEQAAMRRVDVPFGLTALVVARRPD